MSRIEQIKSKFQSITSANVGIDAFYFDDFSIINSLHSNNFPACILKIPESSEITDYKQQWELFDIVFYICEPRHELEARSIEVQYDDLKILSEEVLNEFVFYPNVYQLLGGVKYEYGHDEGASNLCIVQASFQARVYNCRANAAVGDIVTITDNNNAFVGTVASQTTLKVIAKDTNLTILSPTYTLASGLLTLSNIPLGTNATVKNSDNTFTQNIAAGATYTLDNTTFAIYLDGVLSNTTILPSMVAETLNIILT
jgi:hypothetical protein